MNVRTSGTRNLWPAVAAAFLLVLAGCGDSDGSPAATPTPTTPHTAVPTHTEVPTSTHTEVPTATHTDVPTSTATSTVTATPTSTHTPTEVVTPTATASATDVATATETATPTVTETPVPTPPLVAHGSVQQLYVINTEPGLSVELLDAEGNVVRTATTDAEGSLIFRDLAAGDGYRLRADIDGSPFESEPVRVTAFDEPASEEFYRSQHIGAGYGYLTTRDGTKLAINVLLPGPIENGPYPTVIEYSGYDPANPDQSQPSTLITSNIGYAAVGVNMRGTGCSGGAFQYFEPVQSADGYDVIEIIAAQPWVKGNKVGMVGVSYPGITQLFTAQTQPPHLAAIAPLSIISDSIRGILSPGGILNDGFAVEWINERQNEAKPFGQPWAVKRRDRGDQVCIDNQKLRGQNVDMVQLIYDNRTFVPDLAGHLVPADFVQKIKVPVFLSGAWQDEQTGGYFPNMLDRFTGTDKVHFTLTNGTHVDSLGPAIFTRWLEFLSLYVREEVPQRPFQVNAALQIFAQQIFGVPRITPEPERFNSSMTYEEALAMWESEPPVRILFENGAGTPNVPGLPSASLDLSFDSWPIPSLQPTTWYFGDQGRLQPQAPTGDDIDAYHYDPSRAQLRTFSGSTEAIWRALPAFNWPSPVEGAALSYETDPLAETLVMAGSGSVDLWLQSTSSDTDLQVTLTEVRPDGNEYYVQSGWLRASFRKVEESESSVLRPFHRGLDSDLAPLPPGEFVEARVEIFPFAHIFRAGSRLRLIIDAPGGSRPFWKFDALQPERLTINQIARSATMPSRVVLPVIPDVVVNAPYPPCPSLRGQPCRVYEPFDDQSE